MSFVSITANINHNTIIAHEILTSATILRLNGTQTEQVFDINHITKEEHHERFGIEIKTYPSLRAGFQLVARLEGVFLNK